MRHRRHQEGEPGPDYGPDPSISSFCACVLAVHPPPPGTPTCDVATHQARMKPKSRARPKPQRRPPPRHGPALSSHQVPHSIPPPMMMPPPMKVHLPPTRRADGMLVCVGDTAMKICFGDRARCRSRSELRLTSQESELTGQGLEANFCFTDVAGF